MGRVIALYGRQPKVGRTTAAVNLGILLGRSGRSALIVHLDDQWPAARLLGRDPEGPMPPAQVRPGLELALLDPDTRPAELAASCREWSSEREFLILDLPSNASSVSDALLGLAEDVVLVVSPDRESLPGLAEDLATITGIMGGNPALRVKGILIMKADQDLKQFERFLLRAERHFPVEVFPFCIPTEDDEGGPVVETLPGGRSARGYVELAMEVIDDGE